MMAHGFTNDVLEGLALRCLTTVYAGGRQHKNMKNNRRLPRGKFLDSPERRERGLRIIGQAIGTVGAQVFFGVCRVDAVTYFFAGGDECCDGWSFGGTSAPTRSRRARLPQACRDSSHFPNSLTSAKCRVAASRKSLAAAGSLI
jgi:hypothetical protein